MADLLTVIETEILAELAQDFVLHEEVQDIEVLEVGTQGPPGIQGPVGPAGGAAKVTVGAIPLSGHSAVALDASGVLVPADCRVAAHRGAVLGLVADAYAPGTLAEVQNGYLLEHAGWAWAPGPVFVGIAGGLVQAVPAGALFTQVVGFALSPTRIRVDVPPLIDIA